MAGRLFIDLPSLTWLFLTICLFSFAPLVFSYNLRALYSTISSEAANFLASPQPDASSQQESSASSLYDDMWSELGYFSDNRNLDESLNNSTKNNDVKEILQYISIPIISAIVGFGTNWLALKMTFYPVKFFGVQLLGKYSRCEDQPLGFIGWQGIVPTKARKMASMSVDLMTTKVFNVQEIFRRIEKDKAAVHMRAGFETSIGGIVDEISDKFIISSKTEWKATESLIKQQVTTWALNELPSFTENFMDDLIQHLDDVYDLKDMCVQEMMANPQLLNDIFENVGKKEIRFIRDSGAYFGFLFGLVQLLIWYFYPEGFILPLFGFIVGYATNWIALKMIFQPIDAYDVFICNIHIMTLQGIFLKRQKEASINFAEKIVGTVLHSQNIWYHMLNGPKSDNFKLLLDKHVEVFTDSLVGWFKPIVRSWMGEDNFKEMVQVTKRKSQEQIADIIKFMHEYTDKALDLENEIATKMAALPSKEFERVLHPVFEEDEIKLILVGAFLGVIVGFFQLFIIFGQ